MPDKMQEAADAFVAHLDICNRCEQKPFDLCPEGQRLLNAFAAAHEGYIHDAESSQGSRDRGAQH